MGIPLMRYVGMFSCPGYSGLGDLFSDGEYFANLEQAKSVLRDRFERGDYWRSSVDYAAFDEDGKVTGVGRSDYVFFPSVTEEAEFLLYVVGRDGRVCDDYPDKLLKIGPRGGIRVESC
jgi:hypothetical protein